MSSDFDKYFTALLEWPGNGGDNDSGKHEKRHKVVKECEGRM